MPSDRYPSSLVTRIRMCADYTARLMPATRGRPRLRARGWRMDEDEEQQRREQRERGTEAERVRRAVGLPHDAEHDAGGQRAQALHGIENSECMAAALRRREIGDQRLLGSLGAAEIQTVNEKPRNQRNERCRQREAGI